MYEYENQEFSSIRLLAAYVGIHEKTLTARLRRGMSIKEACENKDLRCHYLQQGLEENSIAQICRDNNKDIDLVRNRLKYGYSINEALNKPKKISRQGKPILVNGVLYNSLAEALRVLDLVGKESTIRSRLRIGWSINDAFMKW
ncbi:MAG: hypothetical protein K6G88_11110 [Lachnospiraceae bacterium]|nr:hypothetical protein [Lachnospiraceae bacterium]